MRGRWTALALVWMAQGAGAAVFLGIPAIGPQVGDAFGLGLRELAVSFGALTLGAGVSVVGWGAMADRVGERRVIVSGLALAAASLGLLSLSGSGLQVPILLALAGVGSASASAASSRSVVAWFGPSERGFAMGIRQAALPLGAGGAAIALPALAAHGSARSSLEALAGVCAVTSALVMAGLREHGDSAVRPVTQAGWVLRDRGVRRIVAASALLSIPQLGLSSFLVLFLVHAHGWTVARAAFMLAAIQLAGAGVRPLVGRLSDLHGGDRLDLIARLAAVEMLALLGLALAARSDGVPLVAAVAAAGVAALCWNGLAAVAAGERAPPGRMGAALGWQASAVFLGGAVTAPLVALVASAASWTAAFAALCLPAGAAFGLLWRASDRRQMEAAKRQLGHALSCMSSGISLIDVTDPAWPVLYVNAAYERLTGYPASQTVGQSWTIGEGPETDPATVARLRDAVSGGREIRDRIRLYRRNTQPYWSETFLSPVVDDDGDVTHYLVVQKDVTEQTEAEQRSSYLAYHDPLTGLPNRTQLDEQLSVALARAGRKKTRVAVLFLDLDGFKTANDRYGHEAGDQLLREIARRWRSLARRGDVLSRHGGDEFVLVMTDVEPAQVRVAAERYVASAREPFTVPASPVPIAISASVGIAMYPDDGSTPAQLLMAADSAMYLAKRAGGSAVAKAVEAA